jgi:transmembrane sensor
MRSHRARLRSLPGTAAEWFAARLGPHDAELEWRFSEWLARDPKNAEEYALCGLTWELSAAAAVGVDGRVDVRPAWYRRGLTYGIATLAATVLLALAIFRFIPPAATEWHTGPGGLSTVVLADGSRITLNTRSTLEVRLGRTRREVRMQEGEAFFEVARDPSRPFVVETPLGVARAVGTRFNVLLEGEREEVATEEGKVLVRALGGSTAGVLATAGTRATLVRGEPQPALDRADLTRIDNWRASRLEFDRVPLEAALREFSRYTSVPVRAPSADVQRTYISAVLKTGDLQALRATLQGAFGLRVVAGKNEWLVVAPSDSAAFPPGTTTER